MIFSRFIFAALFLSAASALRAVTTNDVVTAEVEGRELAQQLRELRPSQSLTNSATLKLRGSKARRAEVPVRISTFVTETNWQTIYGVDSTSEMTLFGVVHASGLEFFHWPGQRLLKREIKKGQSCDVLESRPGDVVTNGYSRVVSWIDRDTGGIVQADAYDVKGKLLKEFEVREFSKVNGEWRVTEVEMRNVQARTSTLLVFDYRQ
jgi:hypothetical protein